jgi:cell division protein FtsB
VTALNAIQPRPVTVRQQAQLRLVAPLAPERVGRGAFILIVLGVVAAGLMIVLIVNTAVAQGSFELTTLKTERASLAERESTLNAQLAALSTPDSLRSKARELGMVPSRNPAFLRVSDGVVLGQPTRAKGRGSTASESGG